MHNHPNCYWLPSSGTSEGSGSLFNQYMPFSDNFCFTHRMMKIYCHPQLLLSFHLPEEFKLYIYALQPFHTNFYASAS